MGRPPVGGNGRESQESGNIRANSSSISERTGNSFRPQAPRSCGNRSVPPSPEASRLRIHRTRRRSYEGDHGQQKGVTLPSLRRPGRSSRTSSSRDGPPGDPVDDRVALHPSGDLSRLSLMAAPNRVAHGVRSHLVTLLVPGDIGLQPPHQVLATLGPYLRLTIRCYSSSHHGLTT